MGFLSKALASGTRNKYERGANYELGNSIASSSVSNAMGTGGKSINVLEEYNGIAWKCINLRAETLADQDLFVERLVNKEWVKDQQHPFNEVLEGGIGSHDLSELLEAHSKSMDLYGESFWYYSKGDKSAKPVAIYLLDPASMTVIIADNKVKGYLYQKDQTRIALELDEVDHYRISNPASPFRGYGPMQAAGWFIRSSRYVTTYMNNFLENNAIPAGVIVSKETINPEEWQLFKQQWSEKYSGIDNAGKTGFIQGADLNFVKTGMSLGEVDFEKIKEASRTDIMIMFGISKPMMAIFDDINRASATVARQLFAITITSPALKRLARKTSKKVAKWYGAQYRVSASNPIPEDEETKLQAYDKGIGRWFTVNEARAAYGLEPIAGGDVITPALASIAPTKSIGKVTIRTKNNKADFSYEMKESFRSEMEGLQNKYEQKFVKVTNTVLTAQKDMVKGQLTPKKVLSSTFNADDEAAKLAGELMPLFVGLASEQGALAAQFVGNADSTFEVTDVMRKYIAKSVAKASLGFTEDTQTLIANAVAESLQAGDSAFDLAKQIDFIYDDVLGVKEPGYRSLRLARTEVIKSSNEITETAYKQSGVVSKKEWLANPGACEFCRALNGSVVQLGGVFVPKNGELSGVDGGTRKNDYEDVKHPGVHSNCRCALIPVIESA